MGALSVRRKSPFRSALLLGIVCAALGACSDSSVDLHLEGEGFYEEVVIEWRMPAGTLFEESTEETLVAEPITLPTTLRLQLPPYVVAENLRELGVRLRSRSRGAVAAGAASFTLSTGEHGDVTIPMRWSFERRDVAFADKSGPGGAQHLVAARLHCSGGVDIAALRAKRLTLLYNDGAAQFHEANLLINALGMNPPIPHRFWADDLDADGRVDLIAGSTGPAQIIRNQTGPTDCENSYLITPEPAINQTRIIDFRTFFIGTRRYPDLAILEGPDNNRLHLAQNSLNGTPPGTSIRFNIMNAPYGTYPSELARVRLGNDDIDDFVVANCTDTIPQIDVYVSQTGVPFPMWNQVVNRNGRKTPCSLVAADFDGSGTAQVMVGFRDEKTLAHARISSAGVLEFGATHQLSFVRGGMGNLTTGDLDGDGVADIALSHTARALLSIVRSAGGGVLEPAANLDASTELGLTRYLGMPYAPPVVSEDFDGDGRRDLAIGSAGPDGVIVFLNRSAE